MVQIQCWACNKLKLYRRVAVYLDPAKLDDQYLQGRVLSPTKLERLVSVSYARRIHDSCQQQNNAKLNLTCKETGNKWSFILYQKKKVVYPYFSIVFCCIFILLVLKFKFFLRLSWAT